MALRPADRENFQTMLRAAENGDLAIIETRRRSDGSYVAMIAAVYQEVPGGEFIIVPFGEMAADDPYEIYEPPAGKPPFGRKRWHPG